MSTKSLFPYIKEGIDIKKTSTGYVIFTIPTQHFKIKSLDELTPERFELEIQKEKDIQDAQNKLFEEIWNDGQNKKNWDKINTDFNNKLILAIKKEIN